MDSKSDAFVSLHGIAHNLVKTSYEDYFTEVPSGLRVFTFAPTNYCIYSNEDSEKMMKWFLSNPNWIHSAETMKGGIFEHCQMYLPGDKITNLMLDGDVGPNYGIYMMTDPDKRVPIVFNREKKETTYDVERVIRELAPKKKNEIRNVYFCICSPHTISPFANSVIKWKGTRWQPPRKATKRYESFSMNTEVLKKANLIQKERLRLDELGRKRFLSHIPQQGRRFTRSMSFPLKLRNGSIDHDPVQIGKGLGEGSAQEKERGLFYKIDKQDKETQRVFELLVN